jgi:radical SAM superfamily enzyme YgiQ (UPF0313 family)
MDEMPDHSKLLLTSVFGPYAVDDAYGRKENLMELFHNQVTREQGIFSYRFNHASFGLYFLAENIDMPMVVLDFPTLPQFIEELKKGYAYIGISYVMPNFRKAQKMAALVRRYAPQSKIILGGHGVAVDETENAIEHDYLCRGEGVSFLRKLFGEDTAKPIKHPLLHSSFNRRVMGVPLPAGSGILIPGVGCANKCRFCATSHFFGEYVTYLKTGDDVFNVCCAYEDKLGVTDFGVMDENFLKFPQRAMRLLECMEKSGRKFTFGIFSSAETITSLSSLDLLVRLGITFVWMGVESKHEVYEKNKGVDFGRLVAELRKRGISVMTSAILFLEEHTKKNLWVDVDFITGLRADYVQFMELGPLPGTKLYRDYEEQGKLCTTEEMPYEERHGQNRIWFKHPEFSREETPGILRKAFEQDYRRNGASFIRAVETAMMGYEYAARSDDPRVKIRAEGFKNFLASTRGFVSAARHFSQNEATAGMLEALQKKYANHFSSPSVKQRALSALITVLTFKECIRTRFFGDVIQPPMKITRYRFETAEGRTENRRDIFNAMEKHQATA